MMTLLFSFEGRISRRSFWLGLFLFVIAGLAISLPLGALVQPQGLASRLFLFVLSLGFCYPLAALVTKRLHDRDKPARPRLHLFLGAVIFSSLINATRIGFVVVQARGLQVELPGPAAYAVLAGCMLVSVVILFELGFLDGTRGPNRFGPDPRQRPVPAA
jgi:uncharacterized membrane protein YhaH (DUF805 family)